MFFGIKKENSSQISKSCENSGFDDVTDIGEYPLGLESIGVDWVGKNIYWTNKKNRAIEVVNYSGTLHQTLDIIHRNESHVLENPRGLAVDSSHGMSKFQIKISFCIFFARAIFQYYNYIVAK